MAGRAFASAFIGVHRRLLFCLTALAAKESI